MALASLYGVVTVEVEGTGLKPCEKLAKKG